MLTVLWFGCKKDKDLSATATAATSETAASTATRAELSADSLFLYAKQIYFWNTSLPDYDTFNPRKYVNSSDDEAGLNDELFRITRYAINPSTGLSYEYYSYDSTETKYSYIDNTDDDNPVAYALPAKSTVDLEGNGYDIGIDIGLWGSVSSYKTYVTQVYPNSPAEKAGMSRGDLITSINGTTIGTSYYSQYNLLVNTFYYNEYSSVTLKGTKRDGSAFSVNLSVSSYKSSPVLCDSVYTSGAKKIGYLAYNAFTTPSNSEPELSKVFSSFASAGVTDLVIDLRYNGGGYVSTAEYLADLIAPSSLNGQTMFAEHFNSLMQAGNATILANQPLLDDNGKVQYQNNKIVTYADVDYSVSGNTYKFSKEGSLDNIQNVVFIVSGGTASASELVINSLKSHINVKIAGDQTYGKPVGFFPVTINKKYDVYFSMFQSKNSNNEGDYWDGFTPDASVSDDPLHLLGDLNEACLYAAYQYLVTGSFPSSSSATSSLKTAQGTKLYKLQAASKPLPARGFRGMIENRIKMKVR